jgi:DNA-binding transcriptional ArsR family regulator
MLDVDVIEDPAAAAAALDPIKSRLLSELIEPASAASLAARVGMARQKVNYHVRGLEAYKLVRVVEDRRWGGLTEHLYEASATSYVVSPVALGPAAANPARATDRLAAGYLVALAARVVHEVAALWRRAVSAEKRLATLSIDTDIRFASAAERAAFTSELTGAISALVARYHDASAPKGRDHRLVVMAYPKPSEAAPQILEAPPR